MRSLPIQLIIIGLLLPLSAAEYPMPEIEDPFGLGPRLALIDHLREELDLKPQNGASLDQLLAMYWRHQGEDALAIARGEAPPSELREQRDAAALQCERIRLLRQTLLSRHNINAAHSLDEDGLKGLLARTEAKIIAQSINVPQTAQPRPTTLLSEEPQPTVKALLETSEPTIAATKSAPGRTPIDSWRSTVERCWNSYAESSTPWTIDYPGDILPVKQYGYRVEYKHGGIEIIQEPPPSPDGIKRYWWARQAHGRAATEYVWQPADWDPLHERWLTTPLEHPRFSRVISEWTTLMNAIMAHPELKDTDAVNWMKHHKNQIRAGLANQDETAAQQACAAALEPAEFFFQARLADHQWMTIHLLKAITNWQRYEMQLPACKTDNTTPSTPEEQQHWESLVRTIHSRLAEQRAGMQRSVALILNHR